MSIILSQRLLGRLLSNVKPSFELLAIRDYHCSIPSCGGGGGGRPGGVPTLTWKQRRILKLSATSGEKKFKARPFGEYSEIEEFIKAKGGPDLLVNISELENWEEPELGEPENAEAECRKIINISMLYGPQKSSGMIKRRDDHAGKRRFSHKRIFGNKGAL